MIAAIEKGFPQMEIAEAAYRFQRQLDADEKIMVGVNKYATDAHIRFRWWILMKRWAKSKSKGSRMCAADATTAP